MTQNIRTTCFKGSAALVLLLFFQFANAQYDFSQLDAKFQQYQHALGDNAIIMIYKDGKIIYTKDKPDFKANTQVHIRECSMWFTAALVMTFVDEGKISLDDKVSKYLPIFADYSKGYITIRQCLSHQTGIAESKGIIKTVYSSLELDVNAIASKHDIETNAGTEFHYSDIGLNIAGRILEIVGKRSFEQLVQQRLFRPLGMRNSSFQIDYDKPANPSNGAMSSAADYTNFLAMLQDKGMFKGKRILSEKAVAEMEKPQIEQAKMKFVPKGAEGWNYGLGEWVVEQDKDGNANVLASPAWPGSWAMIDKCRGYTALIFEEKLTPDEKKDIYMDIKKAIDDQISCNN